LIEEVGVGDMRSASQPAEPTLPMTTDCRICGNPSDNRGFTAREMMFGLGDTFLYVECSRCGCLQLADRPADFARYYPDGYYSFRPREENALVRTLKRIRLQHVFGRRSPLGALLTHWYGLPQDVEAVLRAKPHFDDAILDIGCGDGSLLRDLRAAGFTKLTGIDPYLPGEATGPTGIELRRAEIASTDGSFDLVLMNHAFEHVADPEATLRHVHRVLASGGCALIRIPLADSFAWRHYGTDWVQLDAPRHLFLHTRRSMEALAERTGFRVRCIRHDSTAFQFWGSEQYRRGQSLWGAGGSGEKPNPRCFSRSQLREFAARADELNRAKQGDQACFSLEKQ
jgi:SAM-dependent methyltransferase